jgi:hypothetical protein
VQRQNKEILYLRATMMGLVGRWSARGRSSPRRRRRHGTGAAPERTVTCIKCLQNVPASRTSITEHGEVCDRCG